MYIYLYISTVHIKKYLLIFIICWFTTVIPSLQEMSRIVYLHIHPLHRPNMMASISKSPSLVKAVHANLYSVFKQSAKDFSFPSSIAFLVILREDGDILSNISIFFCAQSELSFFSLNIKNKLYLLLYYK
ncbi:hypothetical protein ALC53_05773 [Atta colombica]|uniref:Uncharacterized protein n=1 Tax=Atta colombica TaxID=520822 RepID=A0A151I3Y8_9HYME|nr:hypothetical protein ALC53_05773 [Atta colombica]